MINAVGRDIPDYLLVNGKEVYQGKNYKDGQLVKKASPIAVRHEKPQEDKLCASIREACEKCGAHDGMTFSFHTEFRDGDYVASKELGQNAMVMTVTLFSVGIFMGVISGTGMVDAMATTIANILPAAMAPHMHWFMALFSVPLMMVLGTDAFYYALLPIIIGIVAPFGVAPESVAATFLLTATFGTPVSPIAPAVYVGLGLADVSIGDHIKYSLKFVWPLSIISLIVSTLLGVIPF